MGVQTAYGHGAVHFAFIGEGDEAVDAVSQGGLAGTGRSDNQDFFTFIDGQVDIVEGGFCLGKVLKCKVFKFNDRLFHASPLIHR